MRWGEFDDKNIGYVNDVLKIMHARYEIPLHQISHRYSS